MYTYHMLYMFLKFLSHGMSSDILPELADPRLSVSPRSLLLEGFGNFFFASRRVRKLFFQNALVFAPQDNLLRHLTSILRHLEGFRLKVGSSVDKNGCSENSGSFRSRTCTRGNQRCTKTATTTKNLLIFDVPSPDGRIFHNGPIRFNYPITSGDANASQK
jgi:hypothetical protein